MRPQVAFVLCYLGYCAVTLALGSLVDENYICATPYVEARRYYFVSKAGVGWTFKADQDKATMNLKRIPITDGVLVYTSTTPQENKRPGLATIDQFLDSQTIYSQESALFKKFKGFANSRYSVNQYSHGGCQFLDVELTAPITDLLKDPFVRKTYNKNNTTVTIDILLFLGLAVPSQLQDEGYYWVTNEDAYHATLIYGLNNDGKEIANATMGECSKSVDPSNFQALYSCKFYTNAKNFLGDFHVLTEEGDVLKFIKVYEQNQHNGIVEVLFRSYNKVDKPIVTGTFTMAASFCPDGNLAKCQVMTYVNNYQYAMGDAGAPINIDISSKIYLSDDPTVLDNSYFFGKGTKRPIITIIINRNSDLIGFATLNFTMAARFVNGKVVPINLRPDEYRFLTTPTISALPLVAKKQLFAQVEITSEALLQNIKADFVDVEFSYSTVLKQRSSNEVDNNGKPTLQQEEAPVATDGMVGAFVEVGGKVSPSDPSSNTNNMLYISYGVMGMGAVLSCMGVVATTIALIAIIVVLKNNSKLAYASM